MAARYPTLPSLAAHICSQGVEDRRPRKTERGCCRTTKKPGARPGSSTRNSRLPASARHGCSHAFGHLSG